MAAMNAVLLAALLAVESGNSTHPHGSNDHGRAVGALQIHKAALADANEYMGSHYTHAQMTNRMIAIKVCSAYLKRYCPKGSLEQQARTWNGGPQGPKSPSTLPYWHRVKVEIQKLNQRNE